MSDTTENSLESGQPTLTINTTTIPRFASKYWRVEGPQTMSFAITNFENGFEAVFRSRMSHDLVGIIWDSEDVKDHALLAYETQFDYSGMVWDFDLAVSSSMPVFNNSSLALTLTVIYEENNQQHTAYIALFNYANHPDARAAHIQIDWNTVKAGFNADQAFPVTNIRRIFFSGFTSSHISNPDSNIALATPEDGYLRLTNSIVTGSNSTLSLQQVVVAPHQLGICTSYDDHYDLNPQRIVDNLTALGYQGMINHYCGMSRYPEMYWDSSVQKWQIPDPLNTGMSVVNPCASKWHQFFSTALHVAAYRPVFGISFEMYSLAANEYWAQKDWNDQLGQTGYTPPSYFFSPCHVNAMAYLDQVFQEFASTLTVGGCDVVMQIGEPWWWYNNSSNLPCVYDYATRLAFHDETGLYAPDLGTITEAMTKSGTPYDEFKLWLKQKLGQTCQNIRSHLKAQYPDAEVGPLIFLPSINTDPATLMTQINYPESYYAYPNFDFVMTEAYDWILQARLDLTHLAIQQIPQTELAYPSNKVGYLAGFVPDAQIAYIYGFDATKPYRLPIWQRVLGDVKNNEASMIMKQLVWAYPQVMFDSITIDAQYPDGFFSDQTYYDLIQDNTPYPANILL
ncbi:non-contractile tail sheath protein [Acinetobacter baylyi]|uniref:Phage capsid protein n=1 Tax=Acinetobacter baylyi (strain ATCC 33305 / BD413 / ADP1) TaxID=62977 RepID=Q6F8X7_ACIAD|nr:hypothetical protein [Acinetobacter baylyi]ENV53410.1 hypothetical protein F952_02471 [Acinetobacter baylyi DSM 14961 = CIP 107474]KAF2370760.1 phage capsid protein [Acinetobacter baylyi]KAF2375102.1 phage capsid protein [Acinetobacter baylyi]KAF2378447.1 phage capsid protein [Acinetobacter baylyi]KAF2380060.1 phage capsid protein [Acinetobacter baylyi]